MAADDEGHLVCGQSAFSGDRCGDAVSFSLPKGGNATDAGKRKGIGRKSRGNSCQRKHPAEILALGPSCASHRRSSNASAAGIRLDHRKSVRPFKGIIWDHISEFEYSHAVGLSASPLVSVGGAFRLASPLSRIDSQWRKPDPADREIRARRQFQAAKALGLAIRQTLSLSRTK